MLQRREWPPGVRFEDAKPTDGGFIGHRLDRGVTQHYSISGNSGLMATRHWLSESV
jgi:hypothetical protein